MIYSGVILLILNKISENKTKKKACCFNFFIMVLCWKVYTYEYIYKSVYKTSIFYDKRISII